MKIAIYAILFSWAGALHAASGSQCGPMPYLYKDYQRLRNHACERKIEEVERYLDQRQRDYEAGKIDDRELIATYEAFSLPFPPEFFTAWLTRYRESYGAHVATARHHFETGWEARGEKYAGKTSRTRFEAMDTHFKQSEKYLARSLELTKKPVASYALLIQIGRHYGRRCDKRGNPTTSNPCLRSLLDTALEIDPKAYWVRRHYMDALQPRWGGSFPAMEMFANETQRAGLPDWQAKRFRAMVLEEKATVAWDKPEERLKFGMQAHELNYSSANLYQIITALVELGRRTEIIPYANRYLEMHPDHQWVTVQRGTALWLQEKHADAYKDFLAAAKMGHAFSQNKVGYFLWTGQGVAPNKAEALAWWEKAAAQGDKDAIRNLAEAKARGITR